MITPSDLRLDGLTAVVTGSSQGIGRACVDALESFGAKVIGLDRAPGSTHLVDVRDVEAVTAIAGELPRVDILVNNAGGTFWSPFEDLSPKGDEALVRSNLLQVVWTTRAFLPALRAAELPSVINVTSIEAHRAAPGFAVYAAAKAGVANLAKSLALELAPVRVNNIAVDVTPTPGVGDLPHATSPLGRKGHVDDTAGAVVYLAGRLSGFVTGSTIHVDGGNHAAAGWHRTPEGWTT
ncbi:SDR family oxidoreductase [Actinocorallia sp. A-T 12471]|uniref:SDR family NAD(P)-dependent oxidoreductase n=1 Tax=Actinocorallia sp. A-T 12471 TaxID=3089813 RepID=UPI0029CC673E|nr:SDR family oxidoreductase [Actinocorallia sp. A-T 12471]MDX6741460.1 SDR family oxidoreductase [Actinocorallia sp. A-T 12471]